MLTRRLPRMMMVAVIIVVLSGIVGLYASYYANVASGAAIVLTCTSLFGAAFLGRGLSDRYRQSPVEEV